MIAYDYTWIWWIGFFLIGSALLIGAYLNARSLAWTLFVGGMLIFTFILLAVG